jgi:two-component system, NtrC family, nitrogen regulation sensor histidine kinase NtrY
VSFRAGVGISLIALLAILGFYAFQRQLAAAWLNLALADEIRQIVDLSAEDQKALRQLDPEREAVYRRRFAEIEATRTRLAILAMSREDMTRRVEMVLLAGFILAGLPLVALWFWSRRREARRLAFIGEGLVALSRGEPPVAVSPIRGRDTIARIARMIELTYRQIREDRRRIASLRQLEQWQETSRRHAHEIRTPLTAARLELDRLSKMVGGGEAEQTIRSIDEEFERLQTFTREFSSFASVGRPRKQRTNLCSAVAEFATTFRDAWPTLDFHVSPSAGEIIVCADREMIRRVLMNLAANAAQVLGETSGMLSLSCRASAGEAFIHVVDSGPGVAAEVRETLFEPYVTTRRIGEGMGLGLAIARKIMLDHDGDLRLVDSRPGHTEFAIVLPLAGDEPC